MVLSVKLTVIQFLDTSLIFSKNGLTTKKLRVSIGAKQKRKEVIFMGQLQLFEYKSNTVRTVQIGDEIWFVAKDVCDILELTNAREAIKSLDNDEKSSVRISDGTSPKGGNPNMNVISESGVYALAFRSNKPEAKNFARWVRKEVLPQIRKTGSYSIGSPSYVIEDSIERAKAWIKEEEERRALAAKNEQLTKTVSVQKQQIAELQPKATYYDVVLACKELMPISIISKDYGWSACQMNDWLHEQGVQYKQGGIWLLYQRYAEQGYTSTKTHIYLDNYGKKHTKVHTYWTQKGRLFLYDLMKSSGNLPIIEQ